MMLTDRYQALWERMHALREAWLELRITVREDVPAGEPTMLVERVGDEIDDAVGAIEEALAALSAALHNPDDIRAGGRALATVHERLTRTADSYWRGLGSAERQRELDSLARRRGGEWAAWERSVDDAHARAPAHLTAISDGLCLAWTELVEVAASGSMSLIANSIGQQINVPGATHAKAGG
jgi:hypothetical protein